jgi:lactoylglutathione lyase
MREGDGSGGLTLESIVPTSRDRSMFRIEHVAFWIENVERLVDFYVAYFGATAGSRYVNVAKGYESRFLSFAGGARIEVMNSSVLHPVKQERGAQRMGLAHLAMSVGSKQRVDELTCRLKKTDSRSLTARGKRETGTMKALS